MTNSKHTDSLLDVLKSKGFEPVVSAIRDKLPYLAEANLLELEAIHSACADEYSADENVAIEAGIEICWRKIEELKTEREGLR